jgi:uncharacterized RDD family membrane protein YckC
MGLVLSLTIITVLVLILTGKLASVEEFLVRLKDSLGWWLVVPTVAVYELVTKGYFILFEFLWNGSTPGKRTQEIRVIRKDGRPISFVAAVIRNILRAVDILGEIYPLGLGDVQIPATDAWGTWPRERSWSGKGNLSRQ